MAASAQINVPAGTTAASLNVTPAKDNQTGNVWVLRNEGTVDVRFGGSDVTRANGQLLAVGEIVTVEAADGETPYAVNTSDSTAGSVSVTRWK